MIDGAANDAGIWIDRQSSGQASLRIFERIAVDVAECRRCVDGKRSAVDRYDRRQWRGHRSVVDARDGDRQSRRREAAVAVRETICDRRDLAAAKLNAVECVVLIERVRAIGVDHEDAAGRPSDRLAHIGRHTIYRCDFQRIAIRVRVVEEHSSCRRCGDIHALGNRFTLVDAGRFGIGNGPQE